MKWLGFHSDKDIWKYFKQQTHQHPVKLLGADTADIHLVDDFLMDVCVTTRAKNSTVYKSEAAYGYCATKKKSFYGFQGHLMTDARGVPVAMTITAANVDGLLIGNKGYIKPSLKSDCHSYGIDLQTPLRKNMIDGRPKWFVRQLMKIRRRIETVIGQLVDYFEIERIRTQDTWHLTSRIARKLLGFTVGTYLNIQVGNESTQFEWLITT